jgi:hypothetical protein
MDNFKDEFFIWIKGTGESYEDSFALNLIKVDKKNRDLIWDLWKAGVGEEFFDSEEVRKKYIIFDYYVLKLMKEKYGVEYEDVDHDTLEYPSHD